MRSVADDDPDAKAVFQDLIDREDGVLWGGCGNTGGKLEIRAGKTLLLIPLRREVLTKALAAAEWGVGD